MRKRNPPLGRLEDQVFSRGGVTFRRHESALSEVDNIYSAGRRVLGIDVSKLTETSTISPIEWILDLSAERDIKKCADSARAHIASFRGQDVWFEVVG